MSAVQQTNTKRVRVMWLALALALRAAFSYLLIQLGLLAVGDLKPTEELAGIVYVAAGGYPFAGLFAGKMDYSKLSWLDRTIARKVGATEGDWRNWEAIRQWARSLPLQPKLVRA